MTLTVLLFGALRDELGESLVADAPAGVTVDALFELLAARHAALRPWKGRAGVAVNEEWAEGERVVEAGDVVALLPPVAGG